MVKFDGIRMADLVEVQDPDKDGGITLVFKEDKFLHIKIVDGKIVTESVPEQATASETFQIEKLFPLVEMIESSRVFPHVLFVELRQQTFFGVL